MLFFDRYPGDPENPERRNRVVNIGVEIGTLLGAGGWGYMLVDMIARADHKVHSGDTIGVAVGAVGIVLTALSHEEYR